LSMELLQFYYSLVTPIRAGCEALLFLNAMVFVES
jgi:hypothetical protein